MNRSIYEIFFFFYVLLTYFCECVICGYNNFQVPVKCIQYPLVHYDEEYVLITVSNLVDYQLTVLPTEVLSVKLPITPPKSPININVHDNSDSYVNKLIGIAIDGIPIYSPLSNPNGDTIDPAFTSSLTKLKVDRCGGSYGPTPDGLRYHYRVMPSCILNKNNIIQNRMNYIIDVDELLDAFQDYFGSFILGYTLSGHPIYSPYDSNGRLQQHSLDNCNGKFVNESYGYYAVPNFPYLKGCDGPGIYDYQLTRTNSETITSKTSHVTYAPCPTGYTSKSTSTGCVPCPAGYYTSSVSARKSSPCGVRCPQGSYCPSTTTRPINCPAGTFGAALGLTDAACSGLCNAGYYCPVGSTKRNALVCGSPEYFCPVGVSAPILVQMGYFTLPESVDHLYHRYNQSVCPIGFYCVSGIRKACPSGTYGNVTGLTSCFICPAGHYCPEASVVPTVCPGGTYGNTTGLATSACSGLCASGYWCPMASVSQTQNICRGGIIAMAAGMATDACSGNCEVTIGIHGMVDATYCIPQPCAAGYYCPPGTIFQTMKLCGSSNMYCPTGSAKPTPVQIGRYSIGSISQRNMDQNISDLYIRTYEAICEPGNYCLNGVRMPCPPGTYGKDWGLVDATCSGLCTPGYYCPLRSDRADFLPCNTTSLYCPRGSGYPLVVPDGYYSIAGVTSSTHSDISPCPPGYYCVAGLRHFCPAGTYASTNRTSKPDCEGFCSPGFYCPTGSTSPRQFACPAGRYGTGGSIDANCTGICNGGYFCPLNSTSPYEKICGGEYLYCPPGSAFPLPVDKKHYSTGGTYLTRIHQSICIGMNIAGTPPAAENRRNICPSTTVW